MNFEKLIGNEEVKHTLNNTIKSRNILHSYLFLGPEGVGKRRFAEEFAKMILCTSKEDCCQKCKSCIQFESKNHPDFLEILSENGSIKIEKIRDLQTKILEKPIISDHKVYIIDDAETMTKEAQNCLLKTLEEPPKYVTIILVVSNESKLLTTIKSRCSKILFHRIEDHLLENFLKEKYGYKDSAKHWIQASGGSIQKAIHIQERREIYEQLDEIFMQVEKYTILDVMNRLELLYKNKEEIYELLDYINYLFYQKIKACPEYISYIEVVEDTKNRLKGNSNYDMCIDRLLFKIWEGNH